MKNMKFVLTLYRIESRVAVAEPEGKREAPGVDTAGAEKMIELLRGYTDKQQTCQDLLHRLDRQERCCKGRKKETNRR